MSAHFLHARFGVDGHRAAADWLRTVEDLALDHDGLRAVRAPERVAFGAAPLLGWRLVSDNRREIARSCRLFTDEQALAANIRALVRDVEQLVVQTTHASRARGIGWFATCDGLLVMMGARRYEKRSGAENASELAMGALRAVAPHDQARTKSAGSSETVRAG